MLLSIYETPQHLPSSAHQISKKVSQSPSREKTISFKQFVLNLRENHSYPLSLIGNMDETLITFDLPYNHSIYVKGEKTVLIGGVGQLIVFGRTIGTIWYDCLFVVWLVCGLGVLLVSYRILIHFNSIGQFEAKTLFEPQEMRRTSQQYFVAWQMELNCVRWLFPVERRFQKKTFILV